MKPERPRSEAVKWIARGYLFLHLHLNLGSLDLLPDWACYALILESLPCLGKEQPSALLLRPLAKILLVWNLWLWISKCFSWNIELLALELILAVISLYFHFQLLTDLANSAQTHQFSGQKTLLTLRTLQTLLITALQFPVLLPNTYHSTIFMILAIFSLIISLCIYTSVSDFSKFLEKKQPPDTLS